MADRKPLWISLLLWCCFATIANAQTSLKWRWEQGRKLGVQFSQKIENVTTVNKRPIPMDIALNMQMTWRVIGVDTDGGATVEQQIDRLTLTLKTSDKAPVEYDSKGSQHSAAARSIAETVGPLVGVPFQFDISSSGEVKGMTWTDKSKAAIEAAKTDTPVSSLLSKDGLAQMLQQTSPSLPAQPVQKGQKWDKRRTFDSAFGKMAQTTEFEFTGMDERDDRSLAHIRVTSELKVETPAEKARSVLKSQTLSGALWFDGQAGLMRESSVRQELRSERAYRNTVIEVHSVSTLTMKVSETP